MGLFAKTANAKSSAGGEYSKSGQYFCLIEAVKFGKQSQDNQEFVAFETRIVYVIRNDEWDGDPKLMPVNMNHKGRGPKPLESTSFVFKDGKQGNEQRLRAFITKALDTTDEEFAKQCGSVAAQEQAFAQMCDPALQPLKNIVIEVNCTPTKTRSQKDIVGSKVLRRVYAEELRVMWEAGKLPPEIVDFFSKENRLTTMLASEAAEKTHKLAHAGK